MGTINKDSVRQRIIRLEVGASEVFPIERYDYITSMAYRVGKRFKHRFTCSTTEDSIIVKRVK